MDGLREGTVGIRYGEGLFIMSAFIDDRDDTVFVTNDKVTPGVKRIPVSIGGKMYEMLADLAASDIEMVL